MPRKNCPGPDMKITEKSAWSPTKQTPCDTQSDLIRMQTSRQSSRVPAMPSL